MTTVKDRLIKFYTSKNLTKSGFEKRCGLSNGYIDKLRECPSQAKLERIYLTFPELSRVWLLTGDGSMLAPNNTESETRPHVPAEAAAGIIGGLSEGVFPDDCIMRPVISAFPVYDLTISIKGDSMEPKYEGGDIVAIRKIDYIEWGKTYVLDTADGVIIKRLYDAGENYKCVSFNKEYPDFLVDKKLVYGVYKVVGLLRV